MPPVTRIPAQRLEDALAGGRYPFWFPREYQNLAFDYFVYGTDFVPLALSATVTQSIQINGESDFLILSAVLVESDTGNTIFLGQRPLLCTLSDSGSGRNFMNTPIHVDNLFGTGTEPKYWDVPKVIARNSVFNVTMQNLEATARNVRVAFHGFKVFGYQS